MARLKLLRQKKGVSQMQLADAIGVSQQSVNKYENHNVEPDIRTLIAIADYFNTSVDYLIGHSDVARVIEDTRPFDLNEEEAGLMKAWRCLCPEEKESIRLVIKNYLNQERNFCRNRERAIEKESDAD